MGSIDLSHLEALPGPSCVSTAPQLKRERSLRARFAEANGNYHNISNAWLVRGFPSSSPLTPTWSVVLAARRDASGIAALSLRNRRRHRGARRRPPAAAPSDAAGIVACGGVLGAAVSPPPRPAGRRRASGATQRRRGDTSAVRRRPG